MTTGEDLRYDVSDQIAEISLARPPVNALSFSLIEQLVAALRRAAADENVRAVVLTSALPRRFCAGLDLSMLLGKSATEMRRLLDKLYVELADAQYNLGKPSIAAVGGSARGGGMTLAISCDVLLAGRSASFGYPEIDLGLVPAIHFVHLTSCALSIVRNRSNNNVCPRCKREQIVPTAQSKICAASA